MALQEPMKGTVRIKRNTWHRGNGPHSFKGELHAGGSRNKRILNRKVRYKSKVLFQNSDYKKICKLIRMVDFT